MRSYYSMIKIKYFEVKASDSNRLIDVHHN